MSRKMLAVILFVFLLGSLSQPPLSLPASLPIRDDAPVVYLPIILHSKPIKVVVTQFNDNPGGYPFYDVIGYVENADNMSFELTLVADVTVEPFPYPGWTPTPPYTKTVLFKPALDVTVPGQRNPFSLQAYCYKGAKSSQLFA